ncbi:type III polyketide synthase [Oceanobacillus halotolerans]|uniref:type III polyketide synthase n=1 Tax=Oceanobacillus halotolerans TaxID=2663380 RepID=UPI0013DC6297|nr:3-oxoacyl-[acyl-carrier-protein] synthase III C-terminal domain-containing protein [Oceanobacillus halotolerans]
MAYICSTGVAIPPNNIQQDEIKQLVQQIFHDNDSRIKRLLPVFDNANVSNRQFVVDANWFTEDHTFQEKNDLYQTYAAEYAVKAVDDCLTNNYFLTRDIPYDAVDMLIFVSSTGIATPSLDVELMNKRPFAEDIKRMPLWGLGCAGGAIGLSRAVDWVKANPDKSALVVCCELCSLTFQKQDLNKSNIIGSALFGDGISAALVCGVDSMLLEDRSSNLPIPKVIETSSLTKKDSTDVMGWNVNNNGLEVIFSKSIPALVHSFWQKHIESFLSKTALGRRQIHSYISHPGGRKVIEAMESVLNESSSKFEKSYSVLREHGNMSSATVLFVLYEWMKEKIEKQEKSIISALGPGFSSELLLVEWI